MKLIVLPLKNWMKYDEMLNNYQETSPVYFKNNVYYRRDLKYAWWEYNKKAWELNIKDLLWRLDSYKYKEKRLRDCEYDALNILYKNKLLNNQMSQLIYMEGHLKNLRNIKIETLKAFLKE